MDLKALLTRLEVLDKKQNLMESEDRKPAKEKERDVTLPSGAKVKSRTVQGWQSQKADKDADKESKKKDESITIKSDIANELLREFGLEEAKKEDEELDEADAAGQNPWANDPVKSAAWSKLTPQDQQWLGGADPTDPYILARAPNKGKPAPAAPAAAAPAMTAADQDDAEMGAAMTANAAAAQAAPAAPTTAQPPAGGAGGPEAVAATRKRMKELLDKLEKTGGVSGAAPAAPGAAKPAAKPATGAATKPAAGGATMPGVDVMGNQTGMPMAAESADDYMLALINKLK